ncbi:MAG: hypothetical protein AAGF66_20500, partial [Cyanobacteria bacterium P01_H01_bin.119]
MLQRLSSRFPSSKKLTLRVFAGVILLVAIAIIAISQLRDNSSVYYPPPPDAPGPDLVWPNLSQSQARQIRKSVTTLTQAEKSAFVNAVNALQATYPEGSQLSRYEQFVVQHILTMGFRQRLGATGPARGNPAHSYP